MAPPWTDASTLFAFFSCPWVCRYWGLHLSQSFNKVYCKAASYLTATFPVMLWEHWTNTFELKSCPVSLSRWWNWASAHESLSTMGCWADFKMPCTERSCCHQPKEKNFCFKFRELIKQELNFLLQKMSLFREKKTVSWESNYFIQETQLIWTLSEEIRNTKSTRNT